MDAREKRGNKIGVVAGSLMLMCSLTISALLGEMTAVYPNVSIDKIQLVLTIPNLIGMLFAFAAGPLTAKFAKKNLLLAGMILGLAGGCIAYFFGSVSLNFLYISSAFIGINQGMNGALTKAIIPDFLDGQERDNMMGYQASSSTAGSVILTFVAGILAGIYWQNSYLVFLGFVPAIIIVAKYITLIPPAQKSVKVGPKEKLNGAVLFTAGTIFLTFMFLFTYQANISLFIKSSGLGDVTTAGYANTTFVVAAMLTGIVFGKFRSKLKFKTMQVGIGLCALGFLSIQIFGNLPSAFFAAFCTGTAQGFVIPSAMLAICDYTTSQSRSNGIAITMGVLNFGMFISPIIMNPIANALVAGDLGSKFMIAGIGLIVVLVGHTLLSPMFYKKENLGQLS